MPERRARASASAQGSYSYVRKTLNSAKRRYDGASVDFRALSNEWRNTAVRLPPVVRAGRSWRRGGTKWWPPAIGRQAPEHAGGRERSRGNAPGSKKWLANRKRVRRAKGGDCSPMKNADLAGNRAEFLAARPQFASRPNRITGSDRNSLDCGILAISDPTLFGLLL